MIVAGQEIVDAGQRYRCVGVEPHTRRDGSFTRLAVLSSACAQCGAAFLIRAPTEASKLQLNRRCAKHKRPGAKARRIDHAQFR